MTQDGGNLICSGGPWPPVRVAFHSVGVAREGHPYKSDHHPEDRMVERRWVRLHLLIHASSLVGLVLCHLLFVSSLDVYAQTASTGALTGTVTDPSGAIIQNANITLRNHGTNETLTAATDQDGLYRFALLPAGEYELTVEAAGFSPVVTRQVMIHITEVRSIRTQLAVKDVKEEVIGIRIILHPGVTINVLFAILAGHQVDLTFLSDEGDIHSQDIFPHTDDGFTGLLVAFGGVCHQG